MDIKLRESIPVGKVLVIVDGKVVYRSFDYRSAAEWAMAQYNLATSDMHAIYRDYKDDYDDIPSEDADNHDEWMEQAIKDGRVDL